MNFKYSSKINKRVWKHLITKKEAFGLKFPDEISITEDDEKMAEKKALEFSLLWNRDKEMRADIFKIYHQELPEILECYIVTPKTSSIDLERKHILVSMFASADKVPTIIIHEFSHIAFLQKWSEFCKKIGYTENGIQDLKEVLTVVNNIEYKNINDKGYPIHKNIRKTVKNMWLEKYDLAEIISDSRIINLMNSLNTIQGRKKKK